MQLPLGVVVTLHTGIKLTVVGEVDIVDNGRKLKKLVGRLSTSRFIGEQLVSYILFSLNEVNHE